MADEDVTLDGKPLQSLRVADLKAALEQRNLPKSGQKNALIKRLKGALMLESLQRSSSSHIGLQPNSQIGEEMSQNSFIKQYLAKQQELLRQRLEREAQQVEEDDESPSVTEEDDDDHTEGNNSSSYFSDKPRPMPSQPPLTRAEEEGGGLIMGQGMLARRPDLGPGSMHYHQNSPDVPGVWMQRPSLQLAHENPSTPSPPRAVASLSVRVVGQPDRQGLPPVMPRAQEKEGTAPAEPGSAQSVLQLSRSARAVAGRQEDSDEDEDDEDDDDSEEDDEWGPGPGGARRDVRTPPQPQPPSLSVPPGASRSRRKLQPPQHIPPLQVHQPPMQLRHPTPPPSPPPELSFPLPDTPKQSPPDIDELEGLGPRPGAGPGVATRPPPAMQRQDSDSSSRSSSPEPPLQRRPGPLSLLVRKMESEGAFPAAEPPTVVDTSGGMPRSAAAPTVSVCPSGSNEMPVQRMEREREQQKREKEEKERRLREEKEREQRREEEKKREEEREEKRFEEKEKERKRLEEEKKKQLEEEKKKRLKEERKQLQEEKEKEKRLEEEKEKERKQLEEKEKEKKHLEEEREKEAKRLQEKRYEEEREPENRLPPWKRGQDLSAAAQSSESRARSGDSAMDQGSAFSPQASKTPGLRDASPQRPLSSPPPNTAAATTMPSPTARKPRMFSDTPAGSLVCPTNTESGSVVVTKDQDSSSDSDSGSDSSSSRSSSQDKSRLTRQPKNIDQGKETGDDKKTKSDKGEGRRYPTKREVSEPSAAAVTEVDADSETSMAQSASEANPENSEGRPEESTTPKAFAARKISLTTGSKTSPVSTEGGAGGAGDSETGGAAGRKRRWGSSTAVTTKKPSISITTDSLKSLIPDIKVSQEAVVELHPDELQLSGEDDGQGLDSSRDDQDKGLKIRRTVTQVVAGDSQENGQRNEEEEEEEEEKKTERDRQRRASKDKRNNSYSEETMETQSSTKHDAEATKVTPSDSLVRRSISQQKSGVSVTIDDPVRTARQPSPPRGKVSNIVHVTNLVRPFTLGQLKELLNQTGSMVEEGFWIDKIKSHCYVTYATTEEAVATRAALHGVKWPQSNPKVLTVDFCEQDELDFHRGLLKPDRANEERGAPPAVPLPRLPPLMPERDRERDRAVVGVRDQWAEREREMQRRERARGEREWDRDKIREFARPGEDGRRSRSRDRERRRRERAKSKERKSDKKEKADEPPAKLLDDLFRKTKAAPCIYWLPLSEEQATQRELDRSERLKERERRRKELEDEDKKREEERKERVKGREKEGGSIAGGGRGAEGDRDRERDRDRGGRDREGDKRRDQGRSRGPSGGAGSGRRSRSRSNPRDKRR